jgi:hypothetical protein
MINKEEIIQQLEARGASKETIDKIKNATEREAVNLGWEQLGVSIFFNCVVDKVNFCPGST